MSEGKGRRLWPEVNRAREGQLVASAIWISSIPPENAGISAVLAKQRSELIRCQVGLLYVVNDAYVGRD